MEAFDDARFVRLHSRARRGMYAAADVDGARVVLTPQRAVHNAVWAVQHAAAADGTPYALLRGAYGRYLAASPAPPGAGASHPRAAAQGEVAGDPPCSGLMWHAHPRRCGFVLRSGSGRFLRAAGRFLRWRRAVTAGADDGGAALQWAVERVPVRMTRPSILDPARQLAYPRRRPPLECEVARQVRYVRGGADGSVDEGAWRTVQVVSNDLMQLRLTVACGMGAGRDLPRTTLCVRAGRRGQLAPLLVDLPIGTDRIDVVVLTHGTTADNDLWYPDLDAPYRVDD
ncbi:hypothetical protein ACP4OV_006743 [Aristida adscensionis]